MEKVDNRLEKAALGVGTWMLIAGALILGPIGFVLLLVVLYSMIFQNLALGIVAGLLISSPAILLAIWAPLKWTAVLRERFGKKAQYARGVEPVPEYERD
jgi:MFS superfamily sulfate permease-like transporter